MGLAFALPPDSSFSSLEWLGLMFCPGLKVAWLQMNIGRIEPYSEGFLEVLPEGEDSDYWQIVAIHINGQAYCPTPQLYRSEKLALAKAAQIYDWIAEYEPEIIDGVCYCFQLKLILWQQSKVSYTEAESG